MKHIVIALVIFSACAAVPVQAAEISVSAGTSNFAYDDSGVIDPGEMRYGGDVTFRDRLMDNLDGTIAFEKDPVNGNLLSARASWDTPLLGISAGPSFGVLNSSGDGDGVPVLFQPGVGIGFTFTLPGIVRAEADTDFALPQAANSDGQVYLQKGKLSVGFFLPNVLCSLAVNQKKNALNSLAEPWVRSMTDYGMYTEAFRKGAPWRVSVNFIYRVSDYYVSEDSVANRKIGNLVLGGGLTWSPKNDFSVFVSGDGALYSFSLNDAKVSDLDKLLFDVKAGVTIRTETLAAGR